MKKTSGEFEETLPEHILSKYIKQFNPEMIEIARQSRGFNQTELAECLGCSSSNLSKIEQGLIVPTIEFIKKLSLVLDYPISFFNERTSIYPAISFHRKRESLTTKSRDNIHARINIVKFQIEKLLKAVELIEKLPNLSEMDYPTPQDAAKALRAYWKLPVGRIENLTEVIEDHGGIIINLDFDTKIDGVTLLTPNLPPLIFLNNNMSADRIRFSLAHELGHAVLHDLPTPEQELEANQFAAEFLMPEQQIRSQLQDLTIRKLAELKRYWKVSMAALVKRAKDLEVITERQSRYLFVQLANLGYRKSEPVYFDPEQPRLLRHIVDKHLNELKYTKEQMAEVVKLNYDEFIERYLDRTELSRMKLVRGNL